MSLTEIPITDSGDDERYTSIDYTEAAELDSINDASVRETRIQEGAIAFDKLEESVRNTNREFYVDLVSDLAVIRSTLTTISDFLDEHCKPDDYGDPTSPSVSSFRSKVDEIKENVERLARHHLEQEEIAEDEMAGNGQLITTEASSSTRMSSGAVINRDDAFEVLRKVADFFARTEPHSPVSYALRQVVEWGKMPLPDLLKELIEDTNTLNELGKRIGVTPPQDEE